MTISAFTSPCSGLWPLGEITVAAAGTPVALNVNVGPQTAGVNTPPTGSVRQLILMCPTTGNTGLVYLLRKVVGQTITKANTGFIVAIVGPGQAVTLPNGGPGLSAAINVDDYL